MTRPMMTAVVGAILFGASASLAADKSGVLIVRVTFLHSDGNFDCARALTAGGASTHRPAGEQREDEHEGREAR
jgi:hypothetical protein